MAAIKMIDFALSAERGERLSPRDAIHKACLMRFRPIMMTTVAAILGSLPLALGLGTGMSKSLGISVVGGLIVSQILTLSQHPSFTSASTASVRADHSLPSGICQAKPHRVPEKHETLAMLH